MTTRTLAALTLAMLLAGACSADSGEPEVLGVLVERSETASAAETEATEPEASAEVRDAPAVIDRELADPAQEETTAPPPPPREPATTEPTTEAAEPAQLAEGAGNTYTWTQPEDPPEEGLWWVESSSLPAQDQDADPWNGARVAARDVETSEGRDPATEPVRRATCEGWIEAPVERPVQGTGTLTVELLVNDAVAATGAYPFDGTVEAEDRVRFDRVGDVTVDARDSDTVTCTVRFDAD